MSKYLHDYLRDDEAVLWQSEPSNVTVLEKGNKNNIFRAWLLAIIICGGLIWAYATYNKAPHIAVPICFGLIGLAVLISPLFECNTVKRQKYYITNQRVILEFDAKTFYSMELAAIDDYKLVTDQSNEPTLVLGSVLFPEIHKQLRWRAGHPPIDRQSTTNRNRADGFVFYNVKNADDAIDLLEGRNVTRAA